MAHPFTYCLIHSQAFSHKYSHWIFLVVSSLPKCPPPPLSCHTRTTFFLTSSIGGTTRRPEGSCRQMGPSTCSSQTTGSSFIHSFMMLLTIRCPSMIWCSNDPSESAPNTFKNTSGGSSTTSQESSTTSNPGGRDN